MKLHYSLPMYYGASQQLVDVAKQLRLTPTEAENKLWELLTAEPLYKYRFRRQHPIAGYIADFYCHRLKLVIEVDGGIHEKEEQKQYDIIRNEEMEHFGLKVMRFTNHQVLEETESVKLKINEWLLNPGS